MAANRVLVLNHFALPLSAAGGTRHVEMFGLLRDWESMIIAGRRGLMDGRTIRSEGQLTTVPVTPYRGNGPSRVLNWASYSAAAFIRGMAHRKTDVVYGSSPHLGAGIVGLMIARLKRRPFVLEVRDLWPQILIESGTLDADSRTYRLLKSLEQFLYRSADRIVVLAEGSRTAIEAGGIDPSKILFIPNGAEPADFVVDEDRGALRQRYSFNRFAVVYAGAHGPANGLDLVLEAAEKLQSENVELDFVLFGDGVAKADLVAEVGRRGLTNVKFRDPVAKAEIPGVLAAADAGLHCLADVELFKTGVSPNKLYDYMAAGLPVITNTGGDVAEMVNRAGSGVAVAPNEIDRGARELVETDAATMARYSEAGRRFMLAERSRAAMTARLEDMLNELV